MSYTVKINGIKMEDFNCRAMAEYYANEMWQNFYDADPEATFEGMITINNKPLSYWNGASDEECFGVKLNRQ